LLRDLNRWAAAAKTGSGADLWWRYVARASGVHNVPAVSQCGRQNHHSSTPPTAISNAYFPLLDSSSVVDAQTHESFLAFGGRAQAFGADDDGSDWLALGKRAGKGRIDISWGST